MGKPSFFGELRRRHVVRVAVAYAVVAWLLLQLGAIVFPSLHAPSWCEPVLLAFLALGFPVAALLAWAFEMTPEGVRRTEPAGLTEGRSAEHGRRVERALNATIIVVLATAVGVLAWRQFGARPAQPSTVATVPPPQSTQAPAAATVIPAKSIAVLPFANDSGNPDQRYFSDGLSEDLIIALSQVPGLFVIGRESSFQLRHTTLDSGQIGAKLHVANLLEGSVSREGDEVRVRAELVDTRTGRLRWSDHYDRPYQNLFALQDAITKAVAMALKAKFLGSRNSGAVVQTDRPPSGSLAAYNAYLEGNFYVSQFTDASLRKAIAAYQRAIDADPKYAAAYARLGYAWSILGGFFSNSRSELARAMEEGRSVTDTAIRLNPDLAAGYVTRGRLLRITLDWHGAEAAFRRALTLDPASADAKQWLGESMAAFGRIDEAIRLGRQAVAANPLDARTYVSLSSNLASDGKLTAAARAVEHAISLEPTGSGFHSQLAAIEVLRGNLGAALQAAQAESNPSWRTWALALTYQAAGDKAHAEQELQDFIGTNAGSAAYQIAEIYAYRGQPDEAFAWLHRAWRQRDGGINYLLSDPFLLRYKDDSRFASFCRKVGLPTPDEVQSTSSLNPGASAL